MSAPIADSVCELLEAKRLAFKNQVLSTHFGRIASIQDFKRLKGNNAFATRKSVRFCPENSQTYEAFLSKEESLDTWLSEAEEGAARQSIAAIVRAWQKSCQESDTTSSESLDECMRGLEHYMDNAARDRRVSHGRLMRHTVLCCLQEHGASAAATLSRELSAADVREARDVAAKDVAAAMHIHFCNKRGCGDTPPRSNIPEHGPALGYSRFSLRKKPRRPVPHGHIL